MLTKAGALTRDGNAVRDPATKVKGDERYTLALPDPEPAHNEPQEIPLPIVYEDEHLLVVDKPAGLVHPRRAIATEPWSTPCSTIAAVR